jgi:HAD superfamily hydrolase (TIGR01450 family)
VIDFSHKKYFILDLDGTLYAGSQLFPYSVNFLEAVRNTGRKPVFLTNNSSRSNRGYYEKLHSLGIAKDLEEIYTSGTATVEYLRRQGMKRLFVVGTPSMEGEFVEAGFELSDGTGDAKPQAVVLTFDTTFTYDKFCRAHDLITAGVPFYATHPDNHVPLENGVMHPDIGTFISAFRTSTGVSPFIVGKPEKHIYEQLQARLGCSVEEMIMVGDRLNTDILGANDFGIDTVLVMSGETTREMLKSAPAKQKPVMVAENVGELIAHLNAAL